MAAEEKCKTAFHTKQGLFEYAEILFRLTNAPTSVEEIMDTIFKDVEGGMWYYDNILIYSGNTEAEL